jgi:EAL domain-containing protein (putative c-di-GMP-specific phosphodiesterase class I)
MKAADLALYTAKENGKNTYFFHEHSMNTKFERQIEHQSTIRYFIETGDFKLHYQPIVETKTANVQGAEALFAGNKTKYPNLNIQEMMIAAEETGDIIELGEMILRKACEEFVQHIEPKLGKTPFTFAVNVSARQIEDEDFVDRVKAIVEQTKISPCKLGLEITETALITNYNRTIKKLEQLKAFGIKFSIDDFGKGYSSLSYLRRLSVHKLKIDSSFIEDINDKKSSEIVRTLVLMSKTLGLVSVAEGVETEEQYRFLKRIECDQIQGYLISMPVAADAFVV